MSSVSPISTSELIAAEAIIPADAEPDVTWGRGGIDDWGWTADAEASDEPLARDGRKA